MAKAGYAVHGMDYEGHGKSSGLAGYVPSFDDLVDDLSEHYSNVCGKTKIDQVLSSSVFLDSSKISFFQVTNTLFFHFYPMIETKENLKKMRILLGESMGGAVALLLHRKKPEYWDGAVLVAPMCKVRVS